MFEKLLGTLKRGIVFVISAPAGTGKTTLARMLVDEFPAVQESISCTTRPMRPNEVEGRDYHFLSKDRFKENVLKGEFLEHATVFSHHYGTLRSVVEQGLSKGYHQLLVIDTDGALQLQSEGYEAVYIFIRPPSMGELRARLFNRKTEEKERIEERLSYAEHEMARAEKYDYIVVNDNLHRAYEILRSILISEEHQTKRYHDRQFDK